ncbi:hypothetical protein C1645_865075 [Glomus cerebriforme]|uniref:Uncharacterized protein n=1 Tax=Glomus cerebriforme TaxID=658196 RepID=A0A397S9B2_9GLOM|nr:hypothetical protein C1645_865075 [Glomus cerebriforme]
MAILTRSKTQKSRFVTLSKFEVDRCYRLALEQLSKEVPFKITKSHARTIYSPSLKVMKDIESINNFKALQEIFYIKLKNKYHDLNNQKRSFFDNNNNKEDNETIYSETTSDDYDTLTNTSTCSSCDYSTIDTFIDDDIDWIRSSFDENEEFWDIFRRLLLLNIIIPLIFIISMILLI